MSLALTEIQKGSDPQAELSKVVIHLFLATSLLFSLMFLFLLRS